MAGLGGGSAAIAEGRSDPSSDVVAYFWTGGAPQSHKVRDLSASGFYVLTEERWAPESIVQMTLQKTDTDELNPDDAISVMAKVVRSDSNGVGLHFVMAEFVASNPGLSLPGKGTYKKALERFLQQMSAKRARK